MQSPLDQVLVWDLETIPDLPCVARVNGFDEQDEAAARKALGEKFPKLIFHKIVCIGALIRGAHGGRVDRTQPWSAEHRGADRSRTHPELR